ncbi:MAG: response regulator [Candidatus Auribacterota bacterium]|nr:response regulator [Candidatus Auribacterota bacterium]
MATKKVLIIEDSVVDAAIIQKLLEDEGLEVETAVTGEEGLKKARVNLPDLITLDLMLPGIDGYEVCRRLKAEVSLNHTIVLVISMKDSIEEITKAFKAGADDYVIKPPWPELIAKKIKLYLGQR